MISTSSPPAAGLYSTWSGAPAVSGMRSARGSGPPRSFLARWVEEEGATSLVAELSALGDAVILDTRVVMAALTGSAESGAWPPEEERFASDFMDGGPINTPWLRELVIIAAQKFHLPTSKERPD